MRKSSGGGLRESVVKPAQHKAKTTQTTFGTYSALAARDERASLPAVSRRRDD